AARRGVAAAVGRAPRPAPAVLGGLPPGSGSDGVLVRPPGPPARSPALHAHGERLGHELPVPLKKGDSPLFTQTVKRGQSPFIRLRCRGIDPPPTRTAR